jgi:Undecaprenyl-phosphate glucose phosphotransferase
MFKKRLQLFQSLLVVNDALTLTACWIGAYYLRFFTSLVPVTKGVPLLEDYLSLLFFVLVIWIGTFHLNGLYHRFYSRRKEIWTLFKATFVALMILVFITFFFKRTEFSRLVFLYFGLISFLVIALGRTFLKGYFISLQRRHLSLDRVLIVGARELAQKVAETIQVHPELGLTVIGLLSRGAQKIGTRVQGIEVLGLYEDIDRVIRDHQVNLVIFAMPLLAQQKLEDLLSRIRDEMVDIKIVPDVYRFISLRGGVEEFEGLPFINLRESPMVGLNRVLKRTVDIVLAALGLIFFSPLFILIALAVKLSSPGPVFYRQVRMGLDGRIFEMLKFRSMVVQAEEGTGPVWTQKGDPRRTGVGRMIRRLSLDELPQLMNVLRGEMSLVGPRPERPELIDRFKAKIPNYMLRHKMKAGMTGWAQIHGWRGNTSLEKRIEFDIYYIENWSMFLDYKILLKTLWKGVFSREAY